MRVALIHDWLTGMRGGERVLEVLCELYPDADIYTLFHFPGSVSSTIERHRIITSFLQKFPFVRKHYRSYLPLFPLAAEALRLEGYDLIISTSHCVARGILPNPEAIHVSYCFTPMRYIWDRRFDYFDRAGRIKRGLIDMVLHYLRIWDVTTVSRTDHFVAISSFVRERIRRYYAREAAVIYPPADCHRFHPSDSRRDYYLLMSAFAPYKRMDQAVLAFNKLNRRLLIVGKGQEEKRLKHLAGKNIEMVGWVPEEALPDLFAGCRALIFPGIEDFGLIPVEVQAAGRPVIAYGRGGVLESVVPYVDREHPGSGLFYQEQTPEAIVEAVKTFERIEDDFDPQWIHTHAQRFGRDRFIREFKALIDGVARPNKRKERG